MYILQNSYAYHSTAIVCFNCFVIIIAVILQAFIYDRLQKCRLEFQSHYKVKISVAHLSIDTSVISV